jgi:hypothetical protein
MRDPLTVHFMYAFEIRLSEKWREPRKDYVVRN